MWEKRRKGGDKFLGSANYKNSKLVVTVVFPSDVTGLAMERLKIQFHVVWVLSLSLSLYIYIYIYIYIYCEVLSSNTFLFFS